MTRLLGAGVNRRKVLRGLIGGAGALAATGVTRNLVGAQTCTERVDCVNVQQPTCTAICPTGSSTGNNRGTDGTCCTGNGECCSNNCVSGVCTSGVEPECTVPADCGAQPDMCTEWLCVEGVCELNGGCGAGELCCPEQGGSCAACCNDSDCPVGTPICYNPGDPSDAYCVECTGDGDCGPCESCLNNTCSAYAKYCESTGLCYNNGTGGCCPGTDDVCGDCESCVESACQPIANCCTTDADCSELPCTSCVGGTCTPHGEYCPEDGGYCYNHNMLNECCYDDECSEGHECVDRNCCPTGYDWCSDGQYCYTEREGECCTSDQCAEGHVCIDKTCSECPEGEEYCAEGDYCYTKMTGGCCTDDECGDGHCANKVCVECTGDEVWCEATQSCYDPATGCCADSDCGPCEYCSELNNMCFGSCSQSETCCDGVCVADEIGCCRDFGDYCGLVEVTSAGGDDRQYDCCDGLLCCFGQSANVCGECCADSDCNTDWGGVCNNFICEYPTCDGKWEACDVDSDCCHGLKCYGGVCKSKHHHHHPKPTPEAPVTTLPATGGKSGKSGKNDSTALGMTLATGAAALLAAKYLRQNSEDEATDEA